MLISVVLIWNQVAHPQVAHPQVAHPQVAHPQVAHPQVAHPQVALELYFVLLIVAGIPELLIRDQVAHPQVAFFNLAAEKGQEHKIILALPSKKQKTNLKGKLIPALACHDLSSNQ